ncbi:hypothetical protein [Romboutsia lituseburensis]|uniref:hypothetical protein n=1 Tax=Romboutsia lituseburensis TaxID=1537 RepID=UPI00215AA7AC|nr:hypothetical protein [Romboutsia lituseburensis]MCR8744369.1 hypothetical protein [Romboutsia lituseburensis]
MNNNLQKLSKILLELRSASIQADTGTIKDVMAKYDMLFLGGNFNCIYSVELLHSLKKVFDFEVSNDELNNLIPIACKSLNMNFEPMVEVHNISNANAPADCYSITLWE